MFCDTVNPQIFAGDLYFETHTLIFANMDNDPKYTFFVQGMQTLISANILIIVLQNMYYKILPNSISKDELQQTNKCIILTRLISWIPHDQAIMSYRAYTDRECFFI